MRDVDHALLALAADDNSDLFWTLTLTFPEPIGEVYLADRDITVDGLSHDGLVVPGGFGTIERMATQEEKRLDVSTVRVTVNNFPRLSTGERVTDLFIDEIETVIGDLYLNARDRLGGIHRARRFSGVVQNDIDANEERAVLTLFQIGEIYGARSALRTIGDDFQYARQDARGATIPVILGVVNRAPGRVVKQGIHTRALPVFTNVGSARLNFDAIDLDDSFEVDIDDDGPAQNNWNSGASFPGTPPGPGDSGGCVGSPCDFGDPEPPPDTGDSGGGAGNHVPHFGAGSGGVLSCWDIGTGTIQDQGGGQYGWLAPDTDTDGVSLKCTCAAEVSGSISAGATITSRNLSGFADPINTFSIIEITLSLYASQAACEAGDPPIASHTSEKTAGGCGFGPCFFVEEVCSTAMSGGAGPGVSGAGFAVVRFRKTSTSPNREVKVIDPWISTTGSLC